MGADGNRVTSVEANGAAYLKNARRGLPRRGGRGRLTTPLNEFYRYPIDPTSVLRIYDELITGRSVDPAKIVLIEPTYGDTPIAGANVANLTHRDDVVWSIHDYFAGW